MTIKAAGAAFICLSVGLVYAAEVQLPPMKEGLWESHTQMAIQGKKYDTVGKVCQSHAVEKSMKAVGDDMRKTNECSDVVTQTSASSYSSEGRCLKGGLAGAVTKTTYTFQGDTASRMEMHMIRGQTDTVTIIDSHYLGSCPADMKPGDMIMADGSKTSVNAK